MKAQSSEVTYKHSPDTEEWAISYVNQLRVDAPFGIPDRIFDTMEMLIMPVADELISTRIAKAKLIRAVEILIADASVETAAVLAAMDILKEVRGA